MTDGGGEEERAVVVGAVRREKRRCQGTGCMNVGGKGLLILQGEKGERGRDMPFDKVAAVTASRDAWSQ